MHCLFFHTLPFFSNCVLLFGPATILGLLLKITFDLKPYICHNSLRAWDLCLLFCFNFLLALNFSILIPTRGSAPSSVDLSPVMGIESVSLETGFSQLLIE